MPNNGSARQRQKRLADIERDVLKQVAATHTRLGRNYLRAGQRDLARVEAERARHALMRALEISS